MSSPSLESLVEPQHAQAVGPGTRTRSRGRCGGNGLHTGLRRACAGTSVAAPPALAALTILRGQAAEEAAAQSAQQDGAEMFMGSATIGSSWIKARSGCRGAFSRHQLSADFSMVEFDFRQEQVIPERIPLRGSRASCRLFLAPTKSCNFSKPCRAEVPSGAHLLLCGWTASLRSRGSQDRRRRRRAGRHPGRRGNGAKDRTRRVTLSN